MKKEIGKEQIKAAVSLVSAYGIIAFLVTWRTLVAAQGVLPGFSPIFYVTVCILFSAALPAGFLLPHSKVSKILMIFGSYWVSFQITLFFACLVELPAYIILTALLKILPPSQFAVLSLFLFALTAVLTVYGIIHTRNISVTPYTCEVSRPVFQGKWLRIAQLSDLHLGSINDLKTVRKIVKKTNSLRPDLICITGDTFTENVREVFEFEKIAAELTGLQSRYGVFACLGNHDAGVDLPDMLSFFQKANIRVLEDCAVRQDGVVLLGRSDMAPGGNEGQTRKTIPQCLEPSDKDNLIIVLDHQPGDIERSKEAGVDLLLSGHTHGGQFYPLNRIVRRFFPHYHGCRKYGDMYSIVSSGTCTPIPYVRVGTKSEIAEILLLGGK
ncbi:metallophosphoesterase [Breznakiella homolactica]|uniref:Metallophosphoesterase n=1 Tax=Breznakiella homolactica TaxID=2798577 RepID=A0A7T7XM14_9SPIR|nr:metallophosphoesterase [Breznakiella homolactica]QQO08692.1 metallophosphoesterase [Breznakiella homolactica]